MINSLEMMLYFVWELVFMNLFILFELSECYCMLLFALVVTGGPSGSGKTSLAHKMANIVGCEVVSLESYFKSEQVKDFKYDDFSSLDLSLLSKVGCSKLCISNLVHVQLIYLACCLLIYFVPHSSPSNPSLQYIKIVMYKASFCSGFLC